ncbi:hypothetical protein OZX62_08415 [Bifidobacterium sp. ESL0690]|uniref:hypothetical protein n=1 Tax=Bifidobacterium sp. ESL0690 TaxID=2983214 RepID=UPI0023F94D09|nr:hypothetical protein [Bifidobacterium sp. ESL0690]WEV46446.1 hypothetical protein OZX62_08415 [Bifidobacterium sp. ESL0690]
MNDKLPNLSEALKMEASWLAKTASLTGDHNNTLTWAKETLQSVLASFSIQTSPHGRNRFRTTNSHATFDIYLSSSAGRDEEGKISSWNTFSEKLLSDSTIKIYILSVEDSLHIPQFFIFRDSEMRKILTTKRGTPGLDKNGVLWFYLNQDPNKPEIVKDERQNKRSEQLLPPCYNHWEKVIDQT